MWWVWWEYVSAFILCWVLCNILYCHFPHSYHFVVRYLRHFSLHKGEIQTKLIYYACRGVSRQWLNTSFLLGVANCKSIESCLSRLYIYVSKFSLKISDTGCTWRIINNAKWLNASAAEDASIPLELLSAGCSFARACHGISPACQLSCSPPSLS